MSAKRLRQIWRDLTFGRSNVSNLENCFNNPLTAVKLRRKWYSEKAVPLETIPYRNFDYRQVRHLKGGNIIGHTSLPIGLVGPLTIDGFKYHVPITTMKENLVSSINNSCKLLSTVNISTIITPPISTKYKLKTRHENKLWKYDAVTGILKYDIFDINMEKFNLCAGVQIFIKESLIQETFGIPMGHLIDFFRIVNTNDTYTNLSNKMHRDVISGILSATGYQLDTNSKRIPKIQNVVYSNNDGVEITSVISSLDIKPSKCVYLSAHTGCLKILGIDVNDDAKQKLTHIIGGCVLMHEIAHVQNAIKFIEFT